MLSENGKGIGHTSKATLIWAAEFCKGLKHTGKILLLLLIAIAVFLGKKIVGRALTDIFKFLTVYLYRYTLKPLWTVAQKIAFFIFIWIIKPLAIFFYKAFLLIKKVLVAVLSFIWKYLKIALLFIGGVIKKCCVAVGKVIGKICSAIGRGLKCIGNVIAKIFRFIGGIIKKIFVAIGKFLGLIGRGVAQCFKAIGKIFKKK